MTKTNCGAGKMHWIGGSESVDFVQDVGFMEPRSITVCVIANEAEQASGQSAWAKQSLQKNTERKAVVRLVASLENSVVGGRSLVTGTGRCALYESVNMEI
jgi:hypothetical protein